MADFIYLFKFLKYVGLFDLCSNQQSFTFWNQILFVKKDAASTKKILVLWDHIAKCSLPFVKDHLDSAQCLTCSSDSIVEWRLLVTLRTFVLWEKEGIEWKSGYYLGTNGLKHYILSLYKDYTEVFVGSLCFLYKHVGHFVNWGERHQIHFPAIPTYNGVEVICPRAGPTHSTHWREVFKQPHVR